MQDRTAVMPTSIMSIRLVIQVLVALFVISFGGILLQWGGAGIPQEVVGQTFDGVVLSMKDVRFSHTQRVLASLGINVTLKVPPSFESKEVDRGLEQFVGSRKYHTPTFLKVWSNRMAFIESIEEFVQESNCKSHTWRFFFEDDVAIHPNITSERAKVVLAKGLALADKDGFVFLGICGPNCTESRVLYKEVEAAQCDGTCAHAFGFQQWKAAEFLKEMSGLALEGYEDPVILGIYFDRYLKAYGQKIRKIWVLGSNLKSPVETVWDHFGLLFQDRTLFQSEIGI